MSVKNILGWSGEQSNSRDENSFNNEAALESGPTDANHTTGPAANHEGGGGEDGGAEDVIELKSDQYGNGPQIQELNLNSWDMWCLGITLVIGGQYFGWNVGLTAGFGSFMIATVLIAIGYICLVFCVSELSSALPFPGKFPLFFVISTIFMCFNTVCMYA